MKRFVITLLFAATGMLSPAQWQISNGPYGGNVTRIIRHGLYLVTGTSYAGVFVSSDDGYSWNEANDGLVCREIFDLASDGTRIYATTSAGFFSSSDNGTSWNTVFLEGVPNLRTYRIAANTQAVFVGTDSGLLRTPDHGLTWANKLGIPVTRAIGVHGNTVFVSTQDYDLYRSTDNGETFEEFTPPFPCAVNSFAFRGNYVFMVNDGEVMRSGDNGLTWTEANNGMEDTYVACLLADGTALFAATAYGYHWPGYYTGGVFLSVDDGLSWTLKGLEGKAVSSIESMNGRVIAGLYPGGLYATIDQGAHWAESSDGLVHLPAYTIGAAGTRLFASTSEDVIISTDFGSNWSHFGGLERFSCMVATPTAVIAGGNGISRSADNGDTWHKVLDFSGSGIHVEALAVCGSRILAGTGNEGIFASDDDGLTWHASNLGLADHSITSLAYSGSTVCAGTPMGPFFSNDLGESWYFTPAIPDYFYTEALWGYNGEFLLSGFDLVPLNNCGGIVRTADNGSTWTMTEFKQQNSYASCFASSGTKIIAGLLNGSRKILYTEDSGEHWSVINTGLPAMPCVTSLAISGGKVFAALSDPGNWDLGPGLGVWERLLSEFIPFAISRDSLWFEPGAGNSNVLEITSTTPWEVEGVIPGWLSADKTFGPSGETILFTTTQSNSFPAPRFAEIDIESEGMLRHLVLCQMERIIGIQSEPEAQNLSIYPNPTSGKLIIDSKLTPGKVEVFTMYGEALYTAVSRPGRTAVDLSLYGKGIYQIRVSGEGYNIIKKVLVL